ncbi:MAG TPA: hypothetical protein PLN69_08905 [bacterium]|nr:hypothetical protein [bacterium]
MKEAMIYENFHAPDKIKIEYSSELNSLAKKLKKESWHEENDFRFKTFEPQFLNEFEKLKIEGLEKKPSCGSCILISMLGFSWMLPVRFAASLRPKQMIILGTEKSLNAVVNGMGVIEAIKELSKKYMDSENISFREIEPDKGELQIYKIIREIVKEANGDVFVEITGGQKYMSVGGTLGGYFAGAKVIYSDFYEYKKDDNRPKDLTTYPRLVMNPMDYFGDLMYEKIVAAFNAGSFKEAAILAESLDGKVSNSEKAKFYCQLSKGYGAWDEFKFKEAKKHIRSAKTINVKNEIVEDNKICEHINFICKIIEIEKNHRKCTDSIEGLPLIYNNLAASQRYFNNKTSLSVMLLSSTIEKIACLVMDSIFAGSPPSKGKNSIAKCLKKQNKIEAFHKCGTKINKVLGWGEYNNNIPKSISFWNGIQFLLGIEIIELDDEQLKTLHSLSQSRNLCEFCHGLVPLRDKNIKKKYKHWFDLTLEIVSQWSKTKEEEINNQLNSLKFPELSLP